MAADPTPTPASPPPAPRPLTPEEQVWFAHTGRLPPDLTLCQTGQNPWANRSACPD